MSASCHRLLVVSDFGRDAGEVLEQLARAGYTPMLTSRIQAAMRLAAEHRPAAVLSLLHDNADHLELAQQLDADERTRDIPLIQVRRGWKPTASGKPVSRSHPANLVSPRLVIVSNRGPNDFVWADGRWRTRPSSGGLVSMLAPLATRPDVAWCCCVSEPPDAVEARNGLYTTAADQAEPGLHIEPIPVTAPMFHAYYGEISNEVLWMVQHGLPLAPELSAPHGRRDRAWKHGYVAANRYLADSIAAKGWNPEAFLLQDYHLYPLPGLLRAHFPTTPILHFTHIPFPDLTAWQQLPISWCTQVLEGLLGADIVGFQTSRDVQHFLDCCREMLHCRTDDTEHTIDVADGRLVRVQVYPASVSPEELHSALAGSSLRAARGRLAARSDLQTIVRVDRLDPSKNQLAGFEAFERLLDEHPDLHGRVQFKAFLVPSRTDLEVYRTYRDAVFAKVEAINARFAERCRGPVILTFYTNDREQALAAMADADVLLANSLADGMNLVVKEWAIVSNRPGVVVASECMGVAVEMPECGVLINPADVSATAAALARALAMPLGERHTRLQRLRMRVQAWTAADWLTAQLRDLGLEQVEPLRPSGDLAVDGSETLSRSV